MVVVQSANAAPSISHYLNQGQHNWALQAWYSAIIVTVLEVCFAYRCSVRGNECQSYYTLLCRGEKKSYKVSVCSIWRWPELILKHAHSARRKHCSHLHSSKHTHRHAVCVFLNVSMRCLHVCVSLCVCMCAREHAHGQCCLLLMHGWLRQICVP